jgi:hypothetical protein
MAGTIVADNIQAASTSTLVLKNGVANTPPTIQDSAGTQIGTFCRAWVNFNGTGTVAIRASFNVSSITDNGTGNYTVTLTTAMPDANYSFSLGVQRTASGAQTDQNIIGTINDGSGNVSSSSLRVRSYGSAGNTSSDVDIFAVAIFR